MTRRMALKTDRRTRRKQLRRTRALRAGTRKQKRPRSKSEASPSGQKTRKRARVTKSPVQPPKTRRNAYPRNYAPAAVPQERGYVLRLSTKDATPAKIGRLLADGWVQEDRRLRGSLFFSHPERKAEALRARKAKRQRFKMGELGEALQDIVFEEEVVDQPEEQGVIPSPVVEVGEGIAFDMAALQEEVKEQEKQAREELEREERIKQEREERMKREREERERRLREEEDERERKRREEESKYEMGAMREAIDEDILEDVLQDVAGVRLSTPASSRSPSRRSAKPSPVQMTDDAGVRVPTPVSSKKSKSPARRSAEPSPVQIDDGVGSAQIEAPVSLPKVLPSMFGRDARKRGVSAEDAFRMAALSEALQDVGPRRHSPNRFAMEEMKKALSEVGARRRSPDRFAMKQMAEVLSQGSPRESPGAFAMGELAEALSQGSPRKSPGAFAMGELAEAISEVGVIPPPPKSAKRRSTKKRKSPKSPRDSGAIRKSRKK